jgi:hypothetical protein
MEKKIGEIFFVKNKEKNKKLFSTPVTKLKTHSNGHRQNMLFLN